MADDTEELRPEDEEVQGGAVKSFLEHLEDLRWTIVKCSAAILVGMCVCLFAAPKMVAILKWPLDRAALMPSNTNQVVTVWLSGIEVGSFELKTNQVGSLAMGTNHDVSVALEPVQNGDQQMLAVKVLPPGSTPVRKGPNLIFLDPAAPFMSSLHIGFFGGLLLASPLVLFYVGQFLMPALKVREKKYFMRAFYIGVLLFLAGVCIAFFFIMPRALKFAEQYALWMGVNVPDWRAETYFSFVVKFMLGMGLGFELPVILLALVKIGILNYKKLSGMRRYMIVINLIMGALLTTPEVLTQVVMAICLQILFEASVWVAWYWERQEKKREANANLGLE